MEAKYKVGQKVKVTHWGGYNRTVRNPRHTKSLSP